MLLWQPLLGPRPENPYEWPNVPYPHQLTPSVPISFHRAHSATSPTGGTLYVWNRFTLLPTCCGQSQPCRQSPRVVFRWRVAESGRSGDWTLMDIGVLVAVLGAFANDDPSVFVGGRFEGKDGDRILFVPGGVGSDLRLFGKIAGSPPEDGSGHVRVREALCALALNEWIEIDQTVGELRIRLGERARNLNKAV